MSEITLSETEVQVVLKALLETPAKISWDALVILNSKLNSNGSK